MYYNAAAVRSTDKLFCLGRVCIEIPMPTIFRGDSSSERSVKGIDGPASVFWLRRLQNMASVVTEEYHVPGGQYCSILLLSSAFNFTYLKQLYRTHNDGSIS